MSQSLLYHAFGVREGYEYQETIYQDGCIRFVLSVKPDWIVCPACGGKDIVRKGRRYRELQTVPSRDKRTADNAPRSAPRVISTGLSGAMSRSQSALLAASSRTSA